MTCHPHWHHRLHPFYIRFFLFLCTIRCRLDELQPHRQQGVARHKTDDEDAGRRVYEQLLLNAWRQRRKEAKNLTETCQKLQGEVGL